MSQEKNQGPLDHEQHLFHGGLLNHPIAWRWKTQTKTFLGKRRIETSTRLLLFWLEDLWGKFLGLVLIRARPLVSIQKSTRSWTAPLNKPSGRKVKEKEHRSGGNGVLIPSGGLSQMHIWKANSPPECLRGD